MTGVEFGIVAAATLIIYTAFAGVSRRWLEAHDSFHPFVDLSFMSVVWPVVVLWLLIIMPIRRTYLLCAGKKVEPYT